MTAQSILQGIVQLFNNGGNAKFIHSGANGTIQEKNNQSMSGTLKIATVKADKTSAFLYPEVIATDATVKQNLNLQNCGQRCDCIIIHIDEKNGIYNINFSFIEMKTSAYRSNIPEIKGKFDDTEKCLNQLKQTIQSLGGTFNKKRYFVFRKKPEDQKSVSVNNQAGKSSDNPLFVTVKDSTISRAYNEIIYRIMT